MFFKRSVSAEASFSLFFSFYEMKSTFFLQLFGPIDIELIFFSFFCSISDIYVTALLWLPLFVTLCIIQILHFNRMVWISQRKILFLLLSAVTMARFSSVGTASSPFPEPRIHFELWFCCVIFVCVCFHRLKKAIRVCMKLLRELKIIPREEMNYCFYC